MKKEYTIYAGDKLKGFDGDNPYSVTFDCDPDDIDTASDALVESCLLKDPDEDHQDMIDFENCADDDVATMLKDLKRMHFLSDYEISDVNE